MTRYFLKICYTFSFPFSQSTNSFAHEKTVIWRIESETLYNDLSNQFDEDVALIFYETAQ